MSRTVERIDFKRNKEEVDEIIREILINDDYKEINYNTEIVWKKGTGMMTAMHFIKIEYEGNLLCISGWVQIGTGNIGGKESSLYGFISKIPKKSVRNTIKKIKAAVY